MKAFVYILLIGLFISCSTFTVENEEPFPVDHLTPTTIVTELSVVDVIINQEDFNRMYRKFGWTIVKKGNISWYGQGQQPKNLILDSLPAEVEIKGSGSAKYPLKSLEFTFDKEIDNVALQILNPEKVLDHHSLKTLKSIRVRNSGNDFYGTMFKDLAYVQMAIENDLDIDLMYGEPVHVFVNGSYYGLLNIRNESNVSAISRLRESSKKDVTLMEVDDDNENLEYRDGDEQLAQQLIDALKNGDTDKLWELIDISNFIDYVIFEDYVGNNDWPGRNCKAYSLNGEPFRFFLYDLDRASERPRRHMLPALEYLDYDVALIFQALSKHPEFPAMLKSRQAEIYKKHSTEQFNQIVSRFAARIEDDIQYQIGKYNVPESKLHWRLNIEKLKRSFEVQDRDCRKKYNLQ